MHLLYFFLSTIWDRSSSEWQIPSAQSSLPVYKQQPQGTRLFHECCEQEQRWERKLKKVYKHDWHLHAGGWVLMLCPNLHFYHHTNAKPKHNNAVYFGFHKLRSETSYATSCYNSSNYCKQKRTESLPCSALSAVAVKKKAKKCYFKASRNKTELGSRQKNHKTQPTHQNPTGKRNAFHHLKHVRGLKFVWTQVSPLPTHILVFLKAPVKLQLRCVTALKPPILTASELMLCNNPIL